MTFSLYSRIIHRSASPISGELIVRELLGQPTLLVEGIPQSGGIVKDLWKKGVKALPKLTKAPNILLLGLGGGSVIHLLKKRWPKARVWAVEIDPQVVAVARTYFGLDKVPGLKMITADALNVVSRHQAGVEKGKFDLVIVDLYLGKVLPKFAEQEEFIEKLKALLTEKSVLVFNHLLDQEGKRTVFEFEEKLKKFFPKIKTLRTVSNELLFVYRGK